jgi:tRNA-binding protein
MYFYYNQIKNDDILLIILDPLLPKTKIKYFDNIVAIYNDEKVIGYNILEVSNLEKIDGRGQLFVLSNNLKDKINSLLTSNNLPLITETSNSQFIVGQVIEATEIEGTHLKKCVVDIQTEQLTIVCGAKNVNKNQKVVVAKKGTMMFDGKLINETTLKGHKSSGMICSKYELNLIPENDLSGILILDDKEKIGLSYFREV